MSSAARKSLWFAVYVLCALVVTVAADEKPCTVHGKNKYFDLTALKSSKDYHVTGTDDDLFPINMCQGVRTETYGIKDDTIKDEQVAAFIRRDHGDFVLGKVNTTLSIYDGRPRLVLSEGSKCKSSSGDTLDIRASTIVDFVCDPGVFGPGQPRLVAQLPPGKADSACAFVVEWKTHYACPIGEGGFIWSLFVFLAVTFLTLLTAYTVLGTLYNRFVLQLRGYDQIPQFSLESMRYHTSEAIDWLKDIAAQLDIPGGNGSGPYGARDPRTPNPVSHQAQAGGFSLHDDEANIGFSRPARQPETNPVSHQTQVIAETQRAQEPQSLSQSLSQSLPTSPPPPPKLMTGARVPVKLEVRQASQAEREFMLGEEDEEDDDDDDDEEESDEETPRDESPPHGSQGKPGQPQPPAAGSSNKSLI